MSENEFESIECGIVLVGVVCEKTGREDSGGHQEKRGSGRIEK